MDYKRSQKITARTYRKKKLFPENTLNMKLQQQGEVFNHFKTVIDVEDARVTCNK
jgi:hypothetical protein